MKGRIDLRQVLGEDSLEDSFPGQWTLPRIDSVDSEQVLGPVDIFAGGDIQGPTARIGQPLRFCQISFASSQSLFHPFAIVDVSTCGVPLDDVCCLVMERHVADQQPAVLPVRPANARLEFHGLPGRERSSPCLQKMRAVLGVNSALPTKAKALLDRGAADIAPAPIAKVAI